MTTKPIQFLDDEEQFIDYTSIIDRTSVLYGESGSGKSVLLIDIIKELREHIPLITLISSTNSKTNQFSSIIPEPLIIDVETSEDLINCLHNVVERQQLFVEKTKQSKTGDFEFRMLETLSDENIISTQDKDSIKKINSLITQLEDTIQQTDKNSDITMAQKTEIIEKIRRKQHNIELMREDKILQILRSAIPNLSESKKISKKDKDTLKYIGINPKIMVIVDDCANLLTREVENLPVFKSLFCEGRHSEITALFTFQAVKELESDLRKNSFFNFFTTFETFNLMYGPRSTGTEQEFTKEEMNSIEFKFNSNAKVVKIVVASEHPGYKLFLSREHGNFTCCNHEVRKFLKFKHP